MPVLKLKCNINIEVAIKTKNISIPIKILKSCFYKVSYIFSEIHFVSKVFVLYKYCINLLYYLFVDWKGIDGGMNIFYILIVKLFKTIYIILYIMYILYCKLLKTKYNMCMKLICKIFSNPYSGLDLHCAYFHVFSNKHFLLTFLHII